MRTIWSNRRRWKEEERVNVEGDGISDRHRGIQAKAPDQGKITWNSKQGFDVGGKNIF